jgi:signal transduction histidine kinase/ligand-binding sensor domain-containing protein
MNRCKILVVILSIFFFLSAYAQDPSTYRFEIIDNFNGLPNNSVLQVESDIFGFNWIATADGLCRMETDSRIKKFNKEDYPELKSSNIRALKSDSRGNLWIGTRYSGLTRYNQNTGEWYSYSHNDNDPLSLVDDQVLSITEDGDGNIWIGTDNGLSIYSHETDNFQNYRVDTSDPHAFQSKAMLDVYVDDKNRVWIGTWGSGLYLALYNENRDLSQLQFRQIIPIENQEETYNVWTVSQDDDGRYWVGTFGGGLFYMRLPDGVTDDKRQQEWKPKFLSFYHDINSNALEGVNITKVIMDDNKDLWISTTAGLNHITADNLEKLLDLSNKENYGSYISKIMYDPKDPNSIPYGTIYSLFEDKQGLIWISTIGGLGKYNPSVSQFINYIIDPSFDNTLYSQNIFINENKQSWITGYGEGLQIYDHKKREIISYEEHVGRKFDHGIVLSLLNKKDKLYITTNKKLVIHDLNDNSEIVKVFDDEIRKILDDFLLFSVYVDSKDRLYLCTINGFVLYDITNGEYNYMNSDASDPSALVDNSVTGVLQDSEGDIWISTFNGLSKVDEIDGLNYKFQTFKHSSKDPEHSLPSNQIGCMHEVNKKIYFGLSSGIGSYDLAAEKFERVTGQGENYHVQSITNVGENNLWAGTMDGIVSVDLESGNVKLFNQNDGLSKNKFVPSGVTVDNENHIYFSTINSIIEIDPNLILKNEDKPPVYVTDIKVLSSDGERTYSGYELDELELKRSDYYVSFNFAAINYIHNQKNKYAYRLEGFESKWNYPDNGVTTATYTNLDPGKYTLHVKASNNDGVWNEEGLKLPIIRKAAIIETNLFKILCLLAALLLVFISFKLYTHNVRRRNLEMETLVKERTEELAEKNNQVEELLSKIKIRNIELERIVDLRTKNLREANIDLKRSNGDLEQFAHVASHDLQEPLRTIGTFTSLLNRKYKDSQDASTKEYIEFIVSGVQRMSNLIQSILTYSKVGKELNVELVDTKKLVQAKLTGLSKRIEDNNAKITVGDLPQVRCDGAQIGMVFYNLINNGLKFNKQDVAIIEVNYLPDDSEYFKFAVKDNGIGIEKEYQEKIFELFNRLHLKSEYEGTGIGLTLCERIIAKHGGTIWLESEKDKGTTFYFTIKKNLES